MILALGWKEYREQRTVWVVMAALAAALIYGLAMLPTPHGPDPDSFGSLMAVVLPALAMAGTYGLVCGAITLANERETGTLPLLDALTGRRTGVWWAKFLTGVLLTLTQSFVLIGLVIALGYDKVPVQHSGWYWVLPLVGLEAFAWGMCTSAMCRNVLPAAALATLPIGLIWVVLGNYAGTHVIRAVLSLIALGISVLVFCRDDWGRLSAKVWARSSAAGASPSGWQSLLWLTARQARGEALVLSVLGVLVGLALPYGWPVIWPAATLLLGVLCGTGMFGGEQSTGGYRFLGDQRLPLGRVWGVKIACWLGLAVLISLIIALAAFFRVVAWVAADPNRHWQNALPLNDDPWRDLPSIAIFLTIWLLYGYGIGQLFSMVFRKSAVAVVIALMATATVLTFWVPSLVSGGLHLWQVLFVPVALLAATRFVIWAWASNRLYTPRPALALIGCGLLSAAWIAGNLGYRVIEVPDTGEPFDVRGYVASLPTPEQNQAGDLIRKALRELRKHDTGVLMALNPPPHPEAGMMGGMGMPPGPGAGGAAMGPGAEALPGPPAPHEDHGEYHRRIGQILREGWPVKEQKLGQWLDRMFKGEWFGQLREAADLPLGMVENPRDTIVYRYNSDLDMADRLAPLLGARALQLQARGDDSAALDHLIVLLAVSRNMRNHATTRTYWTGASMELNALHALEQWLTHLEKKPKLLRRALEELQRHEASLPPATDALKGDYVVMRNTLESLSFVSRYFEYGDRQGVSRGIRELAALAGEMPWEKARRQRILNAAYGGYLRFAEAEYPVMADQALTDQEARRTRDGDRTAPGFRYLQSWLPAESGRGASLSRERLDRLIDRSWLGNFWLWQGEVGLSERASLCRVRGSRLVLALGLYAMDKGKSPSSLDELVPGYLPAPLPSDPYSGKSFRYRVSQGEQVHMGDTPDGEAVLRKVPAGQGIVWSVGPDGFDQGGTKQGENRGFQDVLGWTDAGLDWIFFMPEVARK